MSFFSRSAPAAAGTRKHRSRRLADRAAQHRKILRARREPHLGAAPHRRSTSARASSCRSWARRAPASRRCCTSSACTTASGRANTTSRGQPVHRLSPKDRAKLHKQHIGFVFQSYHLLDHLTVYENLEVPLSYRDVKKIRSRQHRLRRARSVQHRRQEGPVSEPALRRTAAARRGGARGDRQPEGRSSPTSPPATCTRVRAARSWSSSRS